MSIVKICKNTPDAIVPTYKDGGYLVYSPDDYNLKAKTPFCIPLGFSMSFPSDYLATMTNVAFPSYVGAIDSDYRGIVAVIVCPEKDMEIKKGDAIGKIYVLKIVCPEVTLSSEPVKLKDDKERDDELLSNIKDMY